MVESRLYLHLTPDGGTHCGTNIDGKSLDYKDFDTRTVNRIECSLEITLKDGVSFSLEEVDKAIDDFYRQIKISGGIEKREKDTSNGTVKLLTNGEFSSNPDKAKQEARTAIELATRLGK